MRFIITSVLILSALIAKISAESWGDLDNRPIPHWYDKKKIGVMLHWGLYSVPSYVSEWFWYKWKNGDQNISNYMEKYYPKNFTYDQFVPLLSGEFYDPEHWSNLIEMSGAKYVVFTAKHLDGFAMFKSNNESWSSVKSGLKRDIVDDLPNAFAKKNLKFGVYYSLSEWYNDLYLQDKEKNFQTNEYVDTVVWPDIKKLINKYEPSIFMVGGDSEAPDTYFQSEKIVKWVYNTNNNIVINDRWGKDSRLKHGDVFTLNSLNTNMTHKWEYILPLDKKSYGFRRNMKIYDVLTIEEIIKTVIMTVSCGGNVLLNIGITKEGTIRPIFQERLKQLGVWLKTYGAAIYETSPWFKQNDGVNPDVWYTAVKKNYDAEKPSSIPPTYETFKAVFAFFLKWPRNNILKLGDVTNSMKQGALTTVFMLGANEKLNWEVVNDVVFVTLPDSVAALDVAWAVKITFSF